MMGVDYIIPFTALPVAETLISKRLDHHLKIKRLNISPRMELNISSQHKSVLEQHLRKDIEIYNFVTEINTIENTST